jgi:aflatoxin B1 aldehyde reductase
MLKGINDAYQAGYFQRFGVSNFKASDVELIHSICKDKGYPLPQVYQGNYNPVARRAETELLPTLRKLNMAFYAYSPLAGGFLVKTKEQIIEGSKDAGRFAQGHALAEQYGSLYSKPSYHKALDLWAECAQAAGCSKGELAYRWVTFDSPLDPKYGDAIIFGCSKLTQVKETQKWLKSGSVGEDAKARIDEIWKTIEKDAPVDNYYR